MEKSNNEGNFVSKTQYQEAQDQIKLYEARQAKINRFKKELGFRLANDFIKFTFRQRDNRTIFAGYFIDREEERLVLSETICSDDDVFDKDLGKLIAVRKSVGENIDDIVEIIELKSKGNMQPYITGSITRGAINGIQIWR